MPILNDQDNNVQRPAQPGDVGYDSTKVGQPLTPNDALPSGPVPLSNPAYSTRLSQRQPMSRHNNQTVTVRRAAEQGDIGFDANNAPQLLIEYPDGTLKVVSRSEVTNEEFVNDDAAPLPPVGYTWDASSGRFKKNSVT